MSRYLGMTLPTLLKTLIISALFVATFRFDLHRLWNKTNPINGDPNWGHAICVPIIGLYYLFMNREALRNVPMEPLLAGRFTRGRFISAAVTTALGLVIYYAVPLLFQFQDLFMAPIRGAGLGLAVLGLLVAVFDWGIGLLLFGLLTFQFGIWPGRNDWTRSDYGRGDHALRRCAADVRLEDDADCMVSHSVFLMLCAFPGPRLLYSKVAMPLQELAAKVAVGTLNLSSGVDAGAGGHEALSHAAARNARSLAECRRGLCRDEDR